MHQHYCSNGFSETKAAVWGGVNGTVSQYPHVVAGQCVGSQPLPVSIPFYKSTADEELTYFSGLSDEAGGPFECFWRRVRARTERSCHISNKLCALWGFFLHFFLFVSLNPSLPFHIPRPHTHSWRFIYFQSVSFCLLHSFSLQLAEIIGGQLLR